MTSTHAFAAHPTDAADPYCQVCNLPANAARHNVPETPYAGTSGWSGSDTSRDRAVGEDADGTTSERQALTLASLADAGRTGLTWRELAASLGLHHGQASGVLSGLHKAGRVARLTERRDRCHPYVLPEHVDGRDTEQQGHRPTAPVATVTEQTWAEDDLMLGDDGALPGVPTEPGPGARVLTGNSEWAKSSQTGKWMPMGRASAGYGWSTLVRLFPDLTIRTKVGP